MYIRYTAKGLTYSTQPLVGAICSGSIKGKFSPVFREHRQEKGLVHLVQKLNSLVWSTSTWNQADLRKSKHRTQSTHGIPCFKSCAFAYKVVWVCFFKTLRLRQKFMHGLSCFSRSHKNKGQIWSQTSLETDQETGNGLSTVA